MADSAPRETINEVDRIGAYTMGHIAGDAIVGFWQSLREGKIPVPLATLLVEEWTGAQWKAMYPSVLHVCASCGNSMDGLEE